MAKLKRKKGHPLSSPKRDTDKHLTLFLYKSLCMFKQCFGNKYEATHIVLEILYDHYQKIGVAEVTKKESAADSFYILKELRVKSNKHYEEDFLHKILNDLTSRKYTKDYTHILPSRNRRTLLTFEGQQAYKIEEYRLKSDDVKHKCFVKFAAIGTLLATIGFGVYQIISS